jgi:hypothetical protein
MVLDCAGLRCCWYLTSVRACCSRSGSVLSSMPPSWAASCRLQVHVVTSVLQIVKTASQEKLAKAAHSTELKTSRQRLHA